MAAKGNVMDKIPIGTIRDLIKALIEGVNTELRGYSLSPTPHLSRDGVVASIVRRAGKSRDLLDQDLTREMLSQATETVVQFALREYGSIVAMPAATEGEQVGLLGTVILSAVAASNTLGVPARNFLRHPKNVQRIRCLVVVAGMACLLHEELSGSDPMNDDAEPSQAELDDMAWDQLFGAITASEEMSLAYAQARVQVEADGFTAFKASLRKALAAHEGHLAPATFRKMLAAAQHAAVVGGLTGTSALGQSWTTGGGSA